MSTIRKVLMAIATIITAPTLLSNEIPTSIVETYTLIDTGKGVSSGKQNQQLLDFAINLSKNDNAETKEVAQWIEDIILGKIACCYYLRESIILICNAELSFQEKINRLLDRKKVAEIKAIKEKKKKQKYAAKAQEEAAKRQKEIMTALAAGVIAVFPAALFLAPIAHALGMAVGKKLVNCSLFIDRSGWS